jgi:hypothetical protein
MTVTRDYFTRCARKWHEDLARGSMENGERLTRDSKVLAGFEGQMREAFDELDRRNADMLAEALQK